MLAWLSVWSEAQTCIWPSWCHCHSLSLASVKSRLVLPFWYWLMRVVAEKRPNVYRNDWTNRAGFWHGGFFPPIPLCVIRKSGYLQNGALSSGTLSQTSDLEMKFRHGKSIALSTKLVVVVDGRACWRRLYDSRRVVAVYYKSTNCNPLTPLLRFVVDSLYSLFLRLTRFWLT